MKTKFEDNLKILAYGNISKLEAMMDHHFLGQLIAVSDEITEIPNTINELNNYIDEKEFTHVVVPDESFHKLNGNFRGCNVPIVELLLDHWVPWAIDRKKQYLEENGIREVLSFSNRFLKPYGEVAKFHTVYCGYDKEIFKDQGKERDIDVLIHGSLGEDTHKWVYPIRNWLAEVLPEIGIKEGINVKIMNHPGYVLNGEINFSEQYSEILNRSKIAIGGSSHWRLPLKKFYEVSACGAILLSDIPLEDQDFFKNRIIEVDSTRIQDKNYGEIMGKRIMNILGNYETYRKVLQPFRTEKDKFDKSYQGRALEMRKFISKIK